MDATQIFLEELAALPDQRARWERLAEYPLGEDERVQAAVAWWKARYYFTDKKKTRTADRFVWFLLCLSGWADRRSTGEKQVLQAYKDAFFSPETQAAIALEDRLEEEIRSACALYIQTLSPHTSIMGFTLNKAPDQQTILRRIGGNVAESLIPGIYTLFRSERYASLVIRGLYQGAQITYPGIEPVLRGIISSYEHEGLRDYVQGCFGQGEVPQDPGIPVPESR